MANKRVFKVATASAVAASALVAAVPASAASVTYEQAEKQVNVAREAANGLHAEYTKNADYKTKVDIKEANDELNRAKAKIAALSDAKQKAYLSSRIQGTIDTVARANAYNNAVRVGTEILPAAHQAVVKAADVASLKEGNVLLAEKIKQAKETFPKVYGKEIQAKFASLYLTADLEADRKDGHYAAITADRVAEGLKLIAAGKVEEAEVQYKNAEASFKAVKGLATIKEIIAADWTELGKKIEAAKVAKVESVSAINATQVEVKFNSAIDKSSVLDANGALQVGATLTLVGLDSQGLTTVTGAKLSEDGKTLTLTTSAPVSKRYDVVVDGLKAANGKDVTKFQQVVSFEADTTAPAILSTTRNSASSFTVKFSEPLNSLGSVSYALADGTVVAGSGQGVTHNFTTGAQEVTFSIGTDVVAGKEVVATFVGAQDRAGNLLTPNPAKASFVKGNADGVAPVVSAVTQTGAKTFTVKFTEQLLANPTVTVTGTTVASIVKDATDPTLYKVTTADVLDGLATVGIANFADLSGEAGSTTNRLVTFVKDTGAPKVTSSTVVVDSTTNKQYLDIVFDKEVVLGTTPTVTGTGSFVKDYVTTAFTTSATTVALKADTKNVLRVELDALLGGTTTDVEGAVYKFDLTFADVKSAAAVAADSTSATFTRGKDGVPANTTVANVVPGSVAQSLTDNNKVNVTFDTAVEGASATNPSNYRIDGAVVESVTLNPVALGQQSVTLNLKAGSNNFTGVRNISVSNVKALGSSKVMTPYFTNTVSLNENIAPVVTSAKLTAVDTIKLTISETITSGANDDFEVLIGGKSQATPEEVDVTVAAGVSTITISAIDAAKLASGISLKALSGLDITDAAGNKLAVPAILTVTQ